MYVVDRELSRRIGAARWCVILFVVGLVATVLLCHTGGLNRYWTRRLPLLLYPSVAAQGAAALVARRGRAARASLIVSLSIWALEMFVALLALMESGYQILAS